MHPYLRYGGIEVIQLDHLKQPLCNVIDFDNTQDTKHFLFGSRIVNELNQNSLALYGRI